MKRYKFIGNPEEYNEEDYSFKILQGDIFNENYSPREWDMDLKSVIKDYPEDWEEVKEEVTLGVKDTNKGMRFNSDKPKLSLISLEELEPMAKVLQFGAEKYARDNWKKGLKFTEILDSMMRHISKLQSGEYYDKESGLSHIGHIQCNALFLGGFNNDIDLDFKDKCCGEWDEEGKCKCNS